VPEFGVVTTHAYDFYVESHGKFPPDLMAMIHEEFKGWHGNYFAVRSSMTTEDGNKQSYAGMMETYLDVELRDRGSFLRFSA